MLQVLIGESEQFSISEQAQIAIEGGCQWLVLRCADIAESDLRELGRELLPLCRENQTILTFEGRPEMARELGVHGVLLPEGEDAAAFRNKFGPEAIIGAYCQDADTIVAYDKADIDYVAMTTRNPSAIVEAVRKKGALIPFVAVGNFTLEDAAPMRLAGYNGICTDSVFSADKPEDYIRSFLKALEF